LYSFRCIQYINGKILLFDYNYPIGSCISSVDGYTWTVIATNQFSYGPSPDLQFSAYSGAVSPTICAFQGYGPVYITDGTNFLTSSNVIQNNPVDIVYSKELGLFAATTGKSVCTSKDGYTWVENFIGSVQSILWSSELGILIAYTPGVVTYTSNDGVQWTLSKVRPALSTSYFYYEYQVGGLYTWSKELGIFAVGNAISKDGINWTITGSTITNSTWCSGLKMFCGSTGDYNNKIVYSYDGINWTIALDFGVDYFHSIAYISTNGVFFVASIGSSFYKSTDGINWYPTPFSQGYSLNSPIIWAQELGLFVTVCQGPAVAQSSDGYNWTITQKVDQTYAFLRAMCWSGTRFAAVSSYTQGVLISPN
jgi:hypothetical protein